MNVSTKYKRVPGNFNTLNTNLVYSGDNIYDIPDIPEQVFRGKDPKDLVPYGSNRYTNKGDLGVHFYIDDYKFESVWSKPLKTLPKLQKYGCVLSPDFSLYTDYPLVTQLWNVYRSRWLANYWIDNNITVIPSIMWGDKRTYDFCFKGIPKNQVVSLSALGSSKNYDFYKDGFEEFLKVVQPRKILLYGTLDKRLKIPSSIEVVKYLTEWGKYSRRS